LYVTKAWKENDNENGREREFHLNILRIDRWNPAQILYEVHNIPILKPKRLEVLRSDDWSKQAEEFVLQFEGENKAYAMPLCSFSQYLHEGRECKPCK